MIKHQITRATIRKSILLQRSSLSLSQQKKASLMISKKIMPMKDFVHSKRVAFYFATRGEVSTIPLLKRALELGKECFLPILHPVKLNQMLFGRYELGDALKKNTFGILEPNPQTTIIVHPWTLDLVLMPLVAFDHQGNRLGMGGGYYDRTFSFLLQRLSLKPRLIGLAYDFQQVPKICAETWDIPLHNVVTESQVLIQT